MSTVLFNHPYKDIHDGSIVTPIKIEEGHSGTNVIYTTTGDDSERIMSLKTWRKYCVAVQFKSREGE
jgi:hypothetical protein